jgi:hypothetical protein
MYDPLCCYNALSLVDDVYIIKSYRRNQDYIVFFIRLK